MNRTTSLETRASAIATSSPLVEAMDRLFDIFSGDPRFTNDLATRPHPLLTVLARDEHTLLFAPAAVWDRGRELLKPHAPNIAASSSMLILLGRPRDGQLDEGLAHGLYAVLPPEPSVDELAVVVHRAHELMETKHRAERRGQSLSRYEYELGELVVIARAMSTERDVHKLLSIILEKSRFITRSDAGSIYVVEGDEPNKSLRFKLTQNDSVHFDSREFVMPLSKRSIAGACAVERRAINIEDVYSLPAGSPFGFDHSFDERIRYRTRSMLTVPLVSQRDEVIGVIQLINKKRESKRKLTSRRDVDEQVIPFDGRSEELLGMVAAQAAASLETALLYEEIRLLFEGFVKASVEAIESRDPTTSGHSRRVADLTVELAKVVDRESTGPYRDAQFSAEDLRELEYASLLHDFGKIGVREKVLVKANKLFDEDLSLIRARFDFVARSVEADVTSRKLRALERGLPRAELDALDRELEERRSQLDAAWRTVLTANEPTVLAAGDFAKVEDLSKETYTDLRGEVHRLLTAEEVASLSVKRGSLTPVEYEEIRSHVVHTYRFLSQIPWGKQFRRVPLIAGAHHERLNGTGYPHRLRAEEIPLQSKLMSIADIYDALTANDRPYKKAVPVERALDILDFGVKDSHLDGDLVRIFREAQVWRHPGGS